MDPDDLNAKVAKKDGGFAKELEVAIDAALETEWDGTQARIKESDLPTVPAAVLSDVLRQYRLKWGVRYRSDEKNGSCYVFEKKRSTGYDFRELQGGQQFHEK